MQQYYSDVKLLHLNWTSEVWLLSVPSLPAYVDILCWIAASTITPSMTSSSYIAHLLAISTIQVNLHVRMHSRGPTERRSIIGCSSVVVLPKLLKNQCYYDFSRRLQCWFSYNGGRSHTAWIWVTGMFWGLFFELPVSFLCILQAY